MSKSKLLFNSFISLIIVFVCLFIFISNLETEITLVNLWGSIYNGCIYLIIATIALIVSVYIRAVRWKYLFQSDTSQPILIYFQLN